MRRVWIEDTTLRDGEQSPDVRFTPQEKLRIGKHLEALGVDMIECGFPITSPGDAEAVKLLAKHLKKSWLRPIARCAKPDIDAAYDAVKDAAKPRISLFISTSALHIKHKLGKTEDEVLEQAVQMTRYARSLGLPVDFAAEDSTRTDRDYLTRFFQAVHEAGSDVLIVCDTVGYTTPGEFGNLIAHLRKNLPVRARLSAHCHDDLGMAVANTLAAVENGAEQVEGTINGIGERAGNASLDEVIMALKVRQDLYNVDISHLNTRELLNASKLVERLTGIKVAQNKAVVGFNAFRHESGIHQDGVLKNPLTYQIIDAAEVGQELNALVLGKHSGRHAFQKKLALLGVTLPPDLVNAAFADFKKLCDSKKKVLDRDVVNLVTSYAEKATTVSAD